MSSNIMAAPPAEPGVDSSKPIEIRPATPEDNDGLLALTRVTPMAEPSPCA